MALGAVQYRTTVRTALEMSGRVDNESHIKLSTNSRNGQFSTFSSSSNSPSFTPTRSRTLGVEVKQKKLTNSSAKRFLGYRQSTHLPFASVGATFIPSQFTQVLGGNHSVQLVSKYITPTFQSYSKFVIDMHNRDDCYTPLLNQTEDARIR